MYSEASALEGDSRTRSAIRFEVRDATQSRSPSRGGEVVANGKPLSRIRKGHAKAKDGKSECIIM